MYGSHLLQTYIVIVLVSAVISIQPPLIPNLDHLRVKPRIENLNKMSIKGKPVPPCIACQSLVKSFLMAVEKTTRQSFAGGDADWEKKLGTYENSELRFIEIQEMLCTDVEFGKDQCYNLAEQYESELEVWFYQNRKKNVDLYKSLCINQIKVCCPNNTYGTHCIPCPGGVDNPCGGHGKCRKGGTREEPANCVCDTGYAGELCNECEKGYYPQQDVATLSCNKCNRACKNHCRGPGPKNCEVCAVGFHFIPDKGCIEYIEDSKQETETSSETTDTDSIKNSSEMNQSAEVYTSGESTNKEDMHLKSNIEDSTSNLPHLEL